jgi:hypothetical protein
VAVDPRKGWLSRLLGKAGEQRVKTITRRHERLAFTVPAEHADAVREAVERWLEGRGVTASVTSTEVSEGKAHLHAELGDADAAKVDLSSDEVQAELEKILSDAMA